ncbi:acetoacetate decarboxylase [Georgenia soli]|uniref:Acetoacetate decarboxylase n=1 Tax=Georgenia soli TaxID=638953 RepID=A0A2A9ES14_9MICO|nr:acetoacetate decarboxylase [Georgenia soli]
MVQVLPPLVSSELANIPAAPESTLPPTASLPEDVPPAPWRCTFHGVMWFQRAGVRAAALLPAPLRPATPRLLIGAHLRYTDTPVGSYSEVFAAVVVRVGARPGAHLPFMAVDSVGSVRGGRANWAIPKTTARFSGDPVGGQALEASGAGWSIRTRARALGPAFPLTLHLRQAQVWPDGTVARSSVTISGRARAALADVSTYSEHQLASWMPPGRHVGLLWQEATLALTPATGRPG